MLTARLTDQMVRTLPCPAKGSVVVWEKLVKGFGVCVTAAGSKSFVVNYRRRADGAQRRYTIGSYPDWSVGTARDEVKRLKRTIDGGADPVGELRTQRAAPTVADLCDRFAAEYLPRRRPSTQKSYLQHLNAEIRPVLGRMKVAAVSFDDVDALHRSISKRDVPYRANRTLATLSAMFSMAVKWKLRPDNPCRGIERNQEHKRRRYLSGDELKRLGKALDKYSDQQSANIIRLLLLTGARRGEVLQAKWEDFDLKSGKWSKPGATTKQKTLHEVPLSDAAVQLLLNIRGHVPKNTEWVFPVTNGLHRRDVKDAWAAICRDAGIKNTRLHDLRHTYASVLASAGLSLPIIGAMLGHTQANTTQRYAHLFDDPLRAAAERASAIITGKPAAEPIPLRREHGR
jgi:integrase